MNIGTVVEGPTDRLVIKSIIKEVFLGEHRFFDLQPRSLGDTFGEAGTGWKGVRRWCLETWTIPGSGLDVIFDEGSEKPLDLLVIHLDGDVVLENDLQTALETPITGLPFPCPPVSPNTGALKEIVCKWLKMDDLPQDVVLALPSQDTENWTFAALYPADPLCQRDDYECIQRGNQRNNHPAYCLTLKEYGKVLKRDGTEIKKSTNRYRLVSGQVGAQWETVCRVCSQAAAFQRGLEKGMEKESDLAS